MKKILHIILSAGLLSVTVASANKPVVDNWSQFVSTPTSSNNVSQNHQLINAHIAYDRGHRGEGVVISIVDTGVDVDHPLFADKLLPGWDATHPIDGPNTKDTQGHGSHVAGIAAGHNLTGQENYRGVASDATIQPIVLQFNGMSDLKRAKMIKKSLDNNAVASNNSWGYVSYITDEETGRPVGYYSIPITELERDDFLITSPREIQAYMDGANEGHIFVFAAGNQINGGDYKYEPGLMAALPTLFPELEGHWVSVVNVDMEGIIANSSHYCGGSAEWCIAAPGSNIASAEAGTGDYVEMTGTSMAAPHVTGAIAVLYSAFPNLDGEKILNRMFVTANKEGIYSNQEIYGQGLMDLDKATLPIGTLQLPTSDGKHQNMHALFNQVSDMGGVLAFDRNQLKDVNLAALDGYDGARFLIPASLMLSNNQQSGLGMTMLKERRFSNQSAQVGDDSKRFALQLLAHHQKSGVDEVSWQWNQTDFTGNHFAVSYNTPYQWTDSQPVQGLLAQTWQHPYLQFAKEGYQLQYQGHSPYAMTVMASIGQVDQHKAEKLGEHGQNYALMAKQPLVASDIVQLSAVSGVTYEEKQFLGSQMSQAFLDAKGTPTMYVGIEGAVSLDDHLQAIAGYYQGKSKVSMKQGGLISQVSALQTQSVQAGLVYHTDDSEQMGLLYRQPLHVTSGNMTMHLPVDVDSDQVVQYQDYQVKLNTKPEQEMTWYYQAPLKDKWDLTVMAQYQAHPQQRSDLNHQASGMLYLNRYL